jgi:hypothetical protein
MQSIRNSISEMVRYNNQTLFDWLQYFVLPLNKFLKSASQQTLDNGKLKTLWKDHFVNQITICYHSTSTCSCLYIVLVPYVTLVLIHYH